MRHRKRIVLWSAREGSVSCWVWPLKVRNYRLEVPITVEQYREALTPPVKSGLGRTDVAILHVHYESAAMIPEMIEMAHAVAANVVVVLSSNALNSLSFCAECILVQPSMMELCETLRVVAVRKRGPKCKDGEQERTRSEKGAEFLLTNSTN